MDSPGGNHPKGLDYDASKDVITFGFTHHIIDDQNELNKNYGIKYIETKLNGYYQMFSIRTVQSHARTDRFDTIFITQCQETLFFHTLI